MPAFEIESHMLTTCVERFDDDEIVATRLLDLTGPVLDGDIQHRALVTFSDRDGPTDPSTVGYLSDGGARGLTIIGWLPMADLEPAVDLLDGQPIVLRYRLSYGSAASGYLDGLRLEPAPAPEPEPESPPRRGRRWARSLGLSARSSG